MPQSSRLGSKTLEACAPLRLPGRAKAPCGSPIGHRCFKYTGLTGSEDRASWPSYKPPLASGCTQSWQPLSSLKK